MNKSVVFTADVIKSLNGLPEAQRTAVTNALVSHFMFGHDIRDSLHGIDATVYALLNWSVNRASVRYRTSAGE